MKKGLAVMLGLMAVVFLAACEKTPTNNPVSNEDENVGIANPASVFCVNNWGTLIPQEDEGGQYALCQLADGSVCEEWEFYRGECGNQENVVYEEENNNVEEENVVYEEENNNVEENSEPASDMRTSLSLEDLEEIDRVLFPKSYTYESYVWTDESQSSNGEYYYPEDVDHSLLLPVHAAMANREIVSSSIEDGMIYTMANVTLHDGSQASVLYINNPSTLEYIAASVTTENETTLYSFAY